MDPTWSDIGMRRDRCGHLGQPLVTGCPFRLHQCQHGWGTKKGGLPKGPPNSYRWRMPEDQAIVKVVTTVSAVSGVKLVMVI